MNPMDSNTRDKIVTNIRDLLAQKGESLPSENSIDVLELLEHGEWGEAFDLMCTQLYEYDVELTEAQYLLVQETGDAMGVNATQWAYLRELVS